MIMVTNARNPLRADPTRTATLRRVFSSDVTRRLKRVRKKLLKIIVDEDALGLRKSTTRNQLSTNARWKFRSAAKQVDAFRAWVEKELQKELIGVTAKNIERAYWKQYIEQSYKKGVGRSFDDLRKPALADQDRVRDFYEGTKDEFLRSAFRRPVAVEKVKILASRVYTDLKGVTEDAATRMTRTLTDGLIQGHNPRKIGKDLAEVLDGVSKNRAVTIARTEVIRAHAEGQLDSLELQGEDKVGVMVEWSTAGDTRVCPLCSELEKVVLKISEARGLLPRHPNCRCAYLPANVGEKKRGQIRGKRDIQKQLDASVRKESPKSKRSLREQKKRSNWAGADLTPSKVRPKSPLEK